MRETSTTGNIVRQSVRYGNKLAERLSLLGADVCLNFLLPRVVGKTLPRLKNGKLFLIIIQYLITIVGLLLSLVIMLLFSKFRG